MSVLGRLLGIETRSISGADIWGDAWVGSSTVAGKRVNDATALTLGAVYGCVRILGDGVSVLPPVVTRGLGSSAEIVARPPSWVDDPNPVLRRVDLMSQVMSSLLLRGNAYLATTRDATGMVVEIWVLDPDLVEVSVDTTKAIRHPTYRIGRTTLGPLDILHIRGMTLPGSATGVSPITAAREAIGLGLAAQEFGGSFFRNGARPGGVIETDGALSATAAKILQATWREAHGGSGNSGKLALLSGGAKYKTISVSPDDAQFLQTRAFGVADIARYYGVPPHLLADSTGSTSWGSGLAEQNVAYVTHSLRPWVQRVEEAFTWLARSERPTVLGAKRLFVTLDLDDLVRGDFASRITTYRSGIESGIFTVNEVRAWEGLPPVDGGDETVRPTYSAPIGASDPAPAPMEGTPA